MLLINYAKNVLRNNIPNITKNPENVIIIGVNVVIKGVINIDDNIQIPINIVATKAIRLFTDIPVTKLVR